MTREEELTGLVGKDDPKVRQLIEEIVFIEKQLIEIKKLPFINVNPKNPMQQKATPASKQYKELLQQYNNSMRLLLRMSGEYGETEEESPLRVWIKGRKEFE